MRLVAIAVAAIICLIAAPVFANSPTEAVRAFYDHVGLELDPAARDRFVDPALSVIAGDEALRKSGQGGCLDPHMPQDGVEDGAEIAKSLKMAEAISGDTAKVVVAFKAGTEPHRLEWKLRRAGGGWKVYDILSVVGEWALSQYGCQ